MAQRRGEEAVRLEGHRLLEPARRLLARLRPVGAERDRAGNRKLFFDQYVALLLLYFFTPTVTSLRSLQQASNWEQMRRKLGIRRTSLGSLSEAAGVFQAKYLRAVVQELACQALPLAQGRETQALAGLTGSTVRSSRRCLAWPGRCGKTRRIGASSSICSSTC